MNCCNCAPSYNVASVAVDSTTGIATITVDATSIAAGRFDLRFRTCGQRISPCLTATLNIVVGTTTYSNVLGRTGNAVQLGQLARQINCCGVVHCNLTTSPAGNIMVLDKVPLCTVATATGTAPTVVTVE